VFKDTFLLSVLLGLDDISAGPFSFSGLFTIFIKTKKWQRGSLKRRFNILKPFSLKLEAAGGC
jgi:hypothetical protein